MRIQQKFIRAVAVTLGMAFLLSVMAVAVEPVPLPDIQLTQFYHNIGFNTEHWTGWPSDDNPYVNEASWHLTWQLVLNKLQPTA